MSATEKTAMKDVMAGLQELGAADLREVAAAAEKLAREKGDHERRQFIEETRRRAAALGVSVSDLFGESGPSGAKRGRKAKPERSRASPAVKYRGPSGEEWSGRGRPPRWVQAVEAEGRSRNDYAV